MRKKIIKTDPHTNIESGMKIFTSVSEGNKCFVVIKLI